MIAHLPMYDSPANAAAHDMLWQAFRDHCPNCRPRSPAVDLWGDWQSPDLFFSQTCGLPFRAKLSQHVTLIATPNHRLNGCPAGYYRSAIITRKGAGIDLDAQDYTFAYNDALSQSGWAAAHAHGICGKARVETGAHKTSAQYVLDGRADVACVDALTWHFLQRDWPAADGLHLIGWTAPTPALPYITALGRDAAAIKTAFAAAITDLGAEGQNQLQLFGLEDIRAQTYLSYDCPPAPA